MLDLTKPENRCTVGGVEYVAVKDSRDSVGRCSNCVACASNDLCDAILSSGMSCSPGFRKDKEGVHWRPAFEIEGAASNRGGYRLLWPDEPHQPGDESFVSNEWTSDDIGAVFRTAFPRRRKVA